MLYKLVVCILLCVLSARGVVADPVTYQQIPQDRDRQLARQVADPNKPPNQTSQSQQPQTEAGADLPKFVRLPDGRIVPYGPGVVCTENCVEPFEARAPNRPRLWVWGIPIIAGGLLAGLLIAGGGGSGPSAGASVTPIPASPTPTPPGTDVPEPSTLVLLGIGMTILVRKRVSGRKADR
ncbi:MAG TPA: PEP-CTERM sorting domain-containing protein [Blastocatellia bacterium]|nr:PEP-CTERM sorting domain-containing protein [Blastocatellia bacterium]